MNATAIRKSTTYILIGLIGLALSAAYLILAFRLPFGRMDQPGAAVFPVVVGFTLVIASLATIAEGWRADRDEEFTLPAGVDRNRVILLIALMVGYVALLPVLGQFAAGALFIALMMRVLSKLSWPRIALWALVMAAGLHFVFVTFLTVPLPTGVLGLDLP